jgi:hypothetical protein
VFQRWPYLLSNFINGWRLSLHLVLSWSLVLFYKNRREVHLILNLSIGMFSMKPLLPFTKWEISLRQTILETGPTIVLQLIKKFERRQYSMFFGPNWLYVQLNMLPLFIQRQWEKNFFLLHLVDFIVLDASYKYPDFELL